MKKKENNDHFKLEYMYDFTHDILGVKVKRKFIYQETIEINEGMLLDFDNNGVSVSLELHEASKKFNVPKYCLIDSVIFNMCVSVNEKFIDVNMNILVRVHIENTHVIGEFTHNKYNIPSIETELCTIV